MSLKEVHLIFIVSSIILALFMGGWAIYRFVESAHSGFLWTAGVSFLFACSLGIYEYFIIKKIQA